MRIKYAFALVALFSSAGAADAASVNRYTSFWAFGDSLSDPGNLNAVQPLDRPDAVDGRLTNGPVWAENVAGDF
jgi:phospholipase/lecithinase/hemolysin